MKHFGTHLCFPIKPKEGIDIKEIATSSHNKTSKAKRDILYNMIDEGANFKILKTKHCNLWTKILNKIKAADNQPEFVQLINIRERYKK